jgi:hypothetical protein
MTSALDRLRSAEASLTEVYTENYRLKLDNALLLAALKDARQALQNDVDPYNQSKAWHRANAAIVRAVSGDPR